MYDCGSIIAKYILCGFNFLIFVIGGLILGLGIWLVADLNSLLGLLSMTSEDNDALKNVIQPEFIKLIAYVIIAIGALLFLISFLGYCGALVESQCMLTTYGLLVLVILVVQIVVGALAFVYRGNIENEIKNELRKTLEDYKPIDENTDTSITMIGWDVVQYQFQCCGIDNYTDFRDNQILNDKNWKIPPSCCHLDKQKKPEDLTCVTEPTHSNSYFDKGCFKILLNMAMEKFNIVIAIVIAVLAIEIITIFLAFCLAKMSSRQRKR